MHLLVVQSANRLGFVGQILTHLQVESSIKYKPLQAVWHALVEVCA
jgi:hypothetical protein